LELKFQKKRGSEENTILKYHREIFSTKRKLLKTLPFFSLPNPISIHTQTQEQKEKKTKKEERKKE
jgi:hypothetical protein